MSNGNQTPDQLEAIRQEEIRQQDIRETEKRREEAEAFLNSITKGGSRNEQSKTCLCGQNGEDMIQRLEHQTSI
jgi:hypothetical protein